MILKLLHVKRAATKRISKAGEPYRASEGRGYPTAACKGEVGALRVGVGKRLRGTTNTVPLGRLPKTR